MQNVFLSEYISVCILFLKHPPPTADSKYLYNEREAKCIYLLLLCMKGGRRRRTRSSHFSRTFHFWDEKYSVGELNKSSWELNSCRILWVEPFACILRKSFFISYFASMHDTAWFVVWEESTLARHIALLYESFIHEKWDKNSFVGS